MSRQDPFDVYCRALDYMEAHLLEKLYLTDIARHCAVSVSGLQKIFLLYGGESVIRCFLDMKLEHAVALLRENCTVSDAAVRLGFSSTAHFSAAFKKKYGIPPLKYRCSLGKPCNLHVE